MTDIQTTEFIRYGDVVGCKAPGDTDRYVVTGDTMRGKYKIEREHDGAPFRLPYASAKRLGTVAETGFVRAVKPELPKLDQGSVVRVSDPKMPNGKYVVLGHTSAERVKVAPLNGGGSTWTVPVAKCRLDHAE